MAFALLCGTPVLAQDAEEDGTFRLGTIFVQALGLGDDDSATVVARELWVGGKVATSLLDTPASVSVITEKEIKQRKAATTEEVLQYSSSVLTDYYGSDDRNDYFLVRGFQATTYRDGLTLGSMRSVREEPLAYERVEVLRGSNSTLFGMGDPGGSVNFVTRQPKFERIADASVGLDAFGSKEVTLDFGNAVEGQDLAFRFTGKLRDGKREYDFSRDDETFLMAGVTWQPTDATNLTFVLDHLTRDATPNSGGYPMDRFYDRGQFFGEPDFNYQDVDRTTGTLLLTHDFGGGLSLRSNLRYSDLNDQFGYVYITDFIGRTGTLVDRDYFGTHTEAKEAIGNVILQYDTDFGNVASSTLAGFEFRNAKTRSASFYGNADPIDLSNPVYSGAPSGAVVPDVPLSQDYTAKSLFLTQNLSFNERLIVTAGLRRDFLDLSQSGANYGSPVDPSSDSFAETSGRFAITYKATEELSFYGSWVESVAPPGIGVQPERGEQFEIGAKYQPQNSNALYSLSIYDLTKNNVTIPVVIDGGEIERQTIGESRVRGFDFEARAELSENLSVIGAYSYMDTEVLRGNVRNTDISGNEFATAPRHSASLWANYTMPQAVPGGDVTLGLGLRYVGSYYFNAYNDQKSDPALLVDASVGLDLNDRMALNLNVKNLFDKQYVVGAGTANYYNPGREVALNLSTKW